MLPAKAAFRPADVLLCGPSVNMPIPVDPLVIAGSVAGILGVTYATFTAVSYSEVKRKIDEQVAQGEDPYELKLEKRAKPPQKKKKAPKRKN